MWNLIKQRIMIDYKMLHDYWYILIAIFVLCFIIEIIIMDYKGRR